MQIKGILLDLDGSAGFLQFVGELLCVFLGDSFLQLLGAVVSDFLSFLQAQAGSGTDDLDDIQLGSAAILQDDVEFGLLFYFSGSSSGSSNSSSSGGNAEGIFQSMDELSQFQNGQALNSFDDSSDLFRRGNILLKVICFVD